MTEELQDNLVDTMPKKIRATTQSTKDVYLANIIRLNSKQPIKYKKNGSPDYDFLKNTDKVLERIQKLKPNSQRTYLISIVTSLKGLKPYEPIYEFYYDKMMTLAEELKKNASHSIERGSAPLTPMPMEWLRSYPSGTEALKAQIITIIDKFFNEGVSV
jgi:hypothetical protein